MADQTTARPVAIRAIARDGTVRWFSWDKAQGTVREAFPPSDASIDLDPLTEFVESFWLSAPPTERWCTAELEGVVVQPKPWAQCLDQKAIIQTRSPFQ